MLPPQYFFYIILQCTRTYLSQITASRFFRPVTNSRALSMNIQDLLTLERLCIGCSGKQSSAYLVRLSILPGTLKPNPVLFVMIMPVHL